MNNLLSRKTTHVAIAAIVGLALFSQQASANKPDPPARTGNYCNCFDDDANKCNSITYRDSDHNFPGQTFEFKCEHFPTSKFDPEPDPAKRHKCHKIVQSRKNPKPLEPGFKKRGYPDCPK